MSLYQNNYCHIFNKIKKTSIETLILCRDIACSKHLVVSWRSGHAMGTCVRPSTFRCLSNSLRMMKKIHSEIYKLWYQDRSPLASD